MPTTTATPRERAPRKGRHAATTTATPAADAPGLDAPGLDADALPRGPAPTVHRADAPDTDDDLDDDDGLDDAPLFPVGVTWDHYGLPPIALPPAALAAVLDTRAALSMLAPEDRGAALFALALTWARERPVPGGTPPECRPSEEPEHIVRALRLRPSNRFQSGKPNMCAVTGETFTLPTGSLAPTLAYDYHNPFTGAFIYDEAEYVHPRLCVSPAALEAAVAASASKQLRTAAASLWEAGAMLGAVLYEGIGTAWPVFETEGEPKVKGVT